MSFTMKDIKRKSPSKQDDIKNCYFYIKNCKLLSSNIKIAIWKYCNYRFKQRSSGRLTNNSLEKMIIELLEKICNKSYLSIDLSDIEQNENEIIYHIKRAIYYGATKSLYYDIDNQINLNLLYSDKVELAPPKSGSRMTSEEVVDYFKDLMI